MLKNSITSKFVSGVVGLSMLAMAMPVGAQTQSVADLTSQINSLLATIASLQSQLAAVQGGSTTAAPANFTTDLTVGATGAEVTKLQTWLVSKGYLTMPAGVAMGNFGGLTKAAVAKYQVAKGIAPAVGYWGAKTRAAANAETVTPGTTTPGTTTPGTLKGGEGNISSFQILGTPSAEDVKAGDVNKEILGFEFKAKGSDLRVDRLDVYFDDGTKVGASKQPWRYLDTITLYQGSTKVATVDASDSSAWSDEGTSGYRVRFSGVNAVVKEGETDQFYVAVTAKDSFSASNIGQGFTVAIGDNGLRAVDAMGINQYEGTFSSDKTTVTFEDVTTGTLALSKAADNPEAAVVEISDTDSTNGVPMLSFKAKAKESDVTITSIPVGVKVSSGTAAQSLKSLHLYKGSIEIASKSVTSGTVTFDDLDVTVPQDESVTFTVKADVNKVSSTLAEGTAASTTVDASALEAEDAAGNSVTPTGDLTSNDMTFRLNGLSVSLISSSQTTQTATLASNGDRGDYTIKFRVNAFGDEDVWIVNDLSTTTATSKLQYALTNETSVSSSGTLTASGTDNEDNGTTAFHVAQGESRDFTLSVTGLARGTAGTSASHQLSIKSISWGTTNAGTGQAYSSNLGDFHTDPVTLIMH